MENASKALIIAGAILIAIILISVGIVVINSVNKPVAQAEQEGKSQAAQMFNAPLTKYAGNNKSTEEVRSLLQVISSRKTKDEVFAFTYSKSQNKIVTYAISTIFGTLDDGKKYNVMMGTKTDNIIQVGTQSFFEATINGTVYRCDKAINFSGKKDGYICWILLVPQ